MALCFGALVQTRIRLGNGGRSHGVCSHSRRQVRAVRLSMELNSETPSETIPDTQGGSGGGAGSGVGGRDDGNNGGGGGDSNEFNEEQMQGVLNLCAETGANIDKVDPNILRAFLSGNIPSFAMMNYLKVITSPISRLFLKLFPWTMSRILADELFLFKVSVEEGLGIFGKLSAEYEQRRGRFTSELDFVLCNLFTAFLVDFALVYLPAPSIGISGKGDGNSWFAKLEKGLPSNVFARDRAYSLGQRVGGYVWTASKLFAVGFACCFASALVTNSIIYLRTKFDSNFKPLNEMQNPFAVSAMYATFLGLSSSSRYQLIAGTEMHVLPALLGKYPLFITEAATLLLRFGNTFWGSQQWVMFATFTGVQKSGE